MNENDYRAIITNARTSLCTPNGTKFSTKASGNQWFTVTFDGKSVDLYYRLNDLYILGFKVGTAGYYFKEGTNFILAGGAVKSLTYMADYKDMGIDRNSAKTVTLESTTNALSALSKCAAKEPDKSFRFTTGSKI